MRRTLLVQLSMGVWLLPANVPAQQTVAPTPQAMAPARALAPPQQVRPSFEGQIRLGGDSGRSATVAIRTMSLAGGLRLDDLGITREGAAIVELRAGELVTVIEGERVERTEGEVWQVRRGVPMGIVTEDDTAVIEVTVVGE